MLLANRVAIITGGTIGIGRSTALMFADEGCSVVVADILAAEGEKTANEVTQKGSNGIFMHCDITDSYQVQDMVEKTISRFGKVDILVNNAGGTLRSGKESSGSIVSITEEQWNKVLALNLKGYVFCCQAVVPYMKDRRFGKIISISSMGVFAPPGPSVDYHSAKAGVLGMTYNLAFELAPHNINVNAILPGPIRTAFWEPVTRGVADKDAYFNGLAQKQVPLGRVGTPEDIAGAALFLASELSSFIAGITIPVAGGIPLSPYHELY